MSPGAPPSTGLLIAGVAAWLGAAALVWLRGVRRAPSRESFAVWIMLLAGGALAVAGAAGPRHDYLAFLEEWEGVLEGLDPWDADAVGSRNAYGPLFVALAPATLVHTLVPKAIFVAAWIAVAVWFVALFQSRPDLRPHVAFVLAYFTLTPYFWVEIALYGHFDVLPAACVLLATHVVLRARAPTAGVLLAVGTLLKLTPALALPFLAVRRREGLRALLGGFAAVLVAASAVAYVIWGASVFHPLTFAADRESRLLSIFQYLRGDYSPLLLVSDDPNVDFLSPVALAVGLSTLLALAAVRRPHPVAALTSAFVLLFALYTVGNPQFQMTVFLLAPYLYATLAESVRRRRSLWVGVGLYLAWYSAFDIVYVVGGMLTEGNWLVAREVLGLPTFLVAGGCFVVLLRAFGAPLAAPPRISYRLRGPALVFPLGRRVAERDV